MDPMTLKQLGDWRLAELREDAARARAGAAAVRAAGPRRREAPRWRRSVGGALVGAGLWVLGGPAGGRVGDADPR